MIRFATLAAIVLVSSVHAADLEVAGLKFIVPSGWKAATETRPMSAGSLVKESDPKIEAIFYHFPGGQGGDVDANLKRWVSQFATEPAPKLERESIKAGDQEITLATITGTYKGSMMRPEPVPLENHVTYAAIVPGPQGNVFIRLNATKSTAETVKADFKTLAASPFAGK